MPVKPKDRPKLAPAEAHKARLATLLPYEERERVGSAAASLYRKFPRKNITYEGIRLRLYSVAWLSLLCGKSTRTIHAWERAGVFPKPIFKLGDGVRWYCAAEIHGYRKIIKAVGLRSGRYSDGQARTAVLRQHSFAFQEAVRRLLKEKTGTVPPVLSDEQELLKSMRTRKIFKIEPDELEKLIRP